MTAYFLFAGGGAGIGYGAFEKTTSPWAFGLGGVILLAIAAAEMAGVSVLS